MKPLQHAKSTVSRHGGRWQDYIEIHNLFDSSKATFASTAHRALLHNELGLALCVALFGEEVVNSDGARVSVRRIAEEHLIEDVGRVPRLDDWLAALPPPPSVRRIRGLPPQIAAFKTDPLGAAAALWGGPREAYADALAFFDQTAAMSDDPRHLFFLHNSFGVWLAERVVGVAIAVPGRGGRTRELATREFGELLVQARMDGFIHPPVRLFGKIAIQDWMVGREVAGAIRAFKRRAERDPTANA